MKRLVLATVMVLAAGCGAQTDDGARASSTAQQAEQNELRPDGKGHETKFAHTSGGSKHTASNGITYHGGPVMLGTVNVYYIWYGNWSGNSATSILPTLIGDLSGSGYEHINTTYTDGAGNHVAGTLHLAGQVNDNYSQGTTLTDAAVQSIVAAHCPALGNCDANGLYVVLTSADVNESSGFCTQYCGWHNNMSANGHDVKYSFVGNPDRCPSSCEEQTTSPNGNAGADGMASIISHESEEAISDPDLNAWYDNRGAENADKCAWTFGTESTASNGSKYNFTGASGTHFLIQQNWVNANGGFCAMSF